MANIPPAEIQKRAAKKKKERVLRDTIGMILAECEDAEKDEALGGGYRLACRKIKGIIERNCEVV